MYTCSGVLGKWNSLKIPKGKSESVYRRRTDNVMAILKERSTKHTHKTKDRVTRTPLKTGGELRCSERLGSVVLI